VQLISNSDVEACAGVQRGGSNPNGGAGTTAMRLARGARCGCRGGLGRGARSEDSETG